MQVGHLAREPPRVTWSRWHGYGVHAVRAGDMGWCMDTAESRPSGVAGWCGPRQGPAEPECDNSNSDNVPSGNQMVGSRGSRRSQLFTKVPAERGIFTT